MSRNLLVAILLMTVVPERCIAQQAKPQPRHLEAVGYDANRDVVVVYGGAAVIDGKLIYYRETHEFRNAGWTTFPAQTRPGPRAGASLVYDSFNQRMLLVGGVSEESGLVIWFDVWAWDGKAWAQVNDSVPVKEPRACYDQRNQRLLVFGDASDKARLVYGDERKFELWEFSKGEWRRLSDQCPQPQGSFEISFDQHRGALLIPVWRNGEFRVWEWNSEWRATSFGSTGPAERDGYDFTYLPDEKCHYLYGGKKEDDFLGDLWRFKDNVWVRIDAEGPVPRATANVVSTGSGLLLFGGAVNREGKTVNTNELWQYKSGFWEEL